MVAAFLESPSSEVKDLAKDELQSLIDTGILKVPDHKAMEKCLLFFKKKKHGEMT